MKKAKSKGYVQYFFGQCLCCYQKGYENNMSDMIHESQKWHVLPQKHGEKPITKGPFDMTLPPIQESNNYNDQQQQGQQGQTQQLNSEVVGGSSNDQPGYAWSSQFSVREFLKLTQRGWSKPASSIPSSLSQDIDTNFENTTTTIVKDVDGGNDDNMRFEVSQIDAEQQQQH